MINELLLLSKKDIPFLEAQVNIHQPTIGEISIIGEESFFSGCQLLNFSKNILKDVDKVDLSDRSDFEVFMSIMCSSEKQVHKNNALMVLALLFPNYQIKCTPSELLLVNEKGISRINTTNFDAFKNILVSMFVLDDSSANGGYNPVDGRAKKIAEKLQKAKKKANDGTKKVAILSRYVSILTVGENKDMNSFMEYTVFQLKDEFKRFQLKQSFDIHVKAKLAGAKDLDEVENWMDNVHPSIIGG